MKNLKNKERSQTMTIRELRTKTGMTQKAFSEYFGIPHRTIQNWEGGQRECPEYLFRLMKYRLENEGIIKKGEQS